MQIVSAHQIVGAARIGQHVTEGAFFAADEVVSKSAAPIDDGADQRYGKQRRENGRALKDPIQWDESVDALVNDGVLGVA